MLKIVYSADGECCSDFKAEALVNSIIDSYLSSGVDVTYKTSNELVLSYFVLRTINKSFPFDDMQFFYENYALVNDPVCGIEYPDDENGKRVSFGFFADVTSSICEAGYKTLREIQQNNR